MPYFFSLFRDFAGVGGIRCGQVVDDKTLLRIGENAVLTVQTFQDLFGRRHDEQNDLRVLRYLARRHGGDVGPVAEGIARCFSAVP